LSGSTIAGTVQRTEPFRPLGTAALLHPRISTKYDITAEDVASFARRLAEEGIALDDPPNPPRIVPDDANDDYLVALALEAEASYLVIRDRHFEKVRVKGVSIVGPHQMVRLLTPKNRS
jgi:predicted nucleic acid-binding protein